MTDLHIIQSMPVYKIERKHIQNGGDDIEKESCAICLEPYLESIRDYGVVFVKTISCFH